MSDGPGYEIVGKISRFDERDTVFSREALLPESAEEIEYHRLNPDLAEVDTRLARFIISKMEGGEDVDQLARAIYESHFIPPAALALPDMVDGTPGSSRISPRPASCCIPTHSSTATPTAGAARNRLSTGRRRSGSS